MVFLSGSELGLCGFRALGPCAKRLYGVVAVLVGEQDVPVVVGLADGLYGLHKGLRLGCCIAAGGRCDAAYLHLADKGLGEGGFALIEQGRNLAVGLLCVAAVREVCGDFLEAAVGLDVLRSCGAQD